MKRAIILVWLMMIAILGVSACQSKSEIIPLHFVSENYSFQPITISRDMIGKITAEYEFDNYKTILFEKADEEDNGVHAGIIANDKTFDLGNVAGRVYADSVKIETENLYGEDLIKITGGFGATYAPTSYYSMKEFEGALTPNLVLRLENYYQHVADLDGDGVKEVVEYRTTIAYLHRYINNGFARADLIADTGASSIGIENNLLVAYYKGQDLPAYYNLTSDGLVRVFQ